MYEIEETEEKINSLDGRKNIRVRAHGISKENGEKLLGVWVDLKLAELEGWTKRSGNKYVKFPEKMLRYRAASWFIDSFFPEVVNSMPSFEEVQESHEPPAAPQFVDVIIGGEPEEENETPALTAQVSTEEKEPKKHSAPWYKAELRKLGVSFDSKLSKPELVALYEHTIKNNSEPEIVEPEVVAPEVTPMDEEEDDLFLPED